MSRDALAPWMDAALGLAEVRLSFAVPMHVLMAEAVDLVRFCRDYWMPVKSGEGARPGLCEAGPLLSPDIADELLALEDALHTAQVEYLLTVPPVHSGLRSRAEHVLGGLVAALEWLLDDGRHDERDKQLATLRHEHVFYSTGIDSLCAKLADYAALASQLRQRLATLADFDMSLIDDAHHLARELHHVCDSTLQSPDTAKALEVRNRIATLLVNRMAQARAAANAVFRNYPAISRLAASTFELRQQSRLQRSVVSGQVSTDQPTRAQLS